MTPRDTTLVIRTIGMLGSLLTTGLLTGCTIQTNLASGPAISRISISTISARSGSNTVNEKVEMPFAADRVTRLNVTSDAGDILVKPAGADQNQIGITATRFISGNLPPDQLRKYLSKVVISAVSDGDKLVVKSTIKPGALPMGVSGYVSYVITVPPRLALELTTISGSVKARGVTGGVTAQSSSGDIELTDMAGALDITDVSGGTKIHHASDAARITVQNSSGDVYLIDVGGTVEATTISGNLTLRDGSIKDALKLESSSGNIIGRGVQAQGQALKFTATNVSGNIEFEGDANELNAHTSSGNIVLKPTKRLTLKSIDADNISGNVEVVLPQSSAATITAHAISGSVILPEGQGSRIHRDDSPGNQNASLTLGAGTAPVSLETSSGDITVRNQP